MGAALGLARLGVIATVTRRIIAEQEALVTCPDTSGPHDRSSMVPAVDVIRHPT
jgi:hypothetical protein